MPRDTLLKIGAGLRDEPILQTSGRVLQLPRNHKLRPIIRAFFDRNDASAAQITKKTDGVWNAAKRYYGAVGKRDWLRKASKPGVDPIDMSRNELPGLLQIALHRQRHDYRAPRAAHA
jgi:hypothetical protein